MIATCTNCAGDTRRAGAVFQDRTYGPGRRVHNMTGGKGDPKLRCTVCEHERPLRTAPAKVVVSNDDDAKGKNKKK